MGLHSTLGDSPRNAFASCVFKPRVFLTSTKKVPYDCVCVGSISSITSFSPENEQIDAAPFPDQNPSTGVDPPSDPPGPGGPFTSPADATGASAITSNRTSTLSSVTLFIPISLPLRSGYLYDSSTAKNYQKNAERAWSNRLRYKPWHNDSVTISDLHILDRSRSVGRPARYVAGVTILLAVMLAGQQPAEAHEITVAVVVAASQDSEPDPTAVVEGLRLAIDQSPDVGHIPGPDAGDHLGGVDVKLIIFETAGYEEATSAVGEAITEGASVIAVVGDNPTLTAAAGDLTTGSEMLIGVLTGPEESDAAIPVAVLRQTDVADPASASFLEDFVASTGREPSGWAALGYDLGQLLDVLIAETDGGPWDRMSLNAIAAEVQARLTVTSFTAPAQNPTTSQATVDAVAAADEVEGGADVEATADADADGNPLSPRMIFVGVMMALAAVATAWWILRRSQSSL